MMSQIQNSAVRALLSPALALLVALGPFPVLAQEGRPNEIPAEDLSTLVRVNITAEIQGSSEPVVINGKHLSDYRPRIIQVFPSTGVVLDNAGHVLTFLGYRWVDLQRASSRIDLITQDGERHKGQLIGIDQNIGVAVIRSLEGKLKKTPICEDCPIKEGITVIAPVLPDDGMPQFRKAQVISSGYGPEPSASDFWMIKINRPLPGVGEPLLDTKHRVLGFVASQRPSPNDPMGVNMAIYHPMSQLLSSAGKILKVGGDIQTGWLGVFINNSGLESPAGVTIENVEKGSPAQKAGLLPGDIVGKYNGKEVHGERQFIRMVQDTPIGANVALNVLRGGKPFVLQALIEARKPVVNPGRFVFNFPDSIQFASSAGPPDMPAVSGVESWGGIEMVPLTPQLADFLAVPGKAGLFVLSVEPQTELGLAGVQAGDVILSVDGRQVESSRGFFSYLRSGGKATRTTVLRLFRKGNEGVRTIEVQKAAAQPRKP